MIRIPALYPILDASLCPDFDTQRRYAEELAAAGVTLLQYRDKSNNVRRIVEAGQALRELLPPPFRLIMNDRADLCVLCGFDGVHLGQDDLSPAAARRIIGGELWLGMSTHNTTQLAEDDKTDADYLAIGPVFETRSKHNPDPVIGLEGIRAARAITEKPLVAIGGITRENARAVLDAGADSVAVISDLCGEPGKSAREFSAIFR